MRERRIVEPRLRDEVQVGEHDVVLVHDRLGRETLGRLEEGLVEPDVAPGDELRTARVAVRAVHGRIVAAADEKVDAVRVR
jgi:hypothetical protein